MKLSRKSVIVASLFVTALGLISGAEARSLAEIKATKTLVVGVSGSVPPFQFKVGTQLTGFEIDMIKAVAEGMGVDIVFSEIPDFVELQNALRNDRVDVILNTISVTSNRDSLFDLTIPYGCLGATVVTLDPKIRATTDLKGKTIGVIKGSIFQYYADKLPFDKKVIPYNTREELHKNFNEGKVDASIGWKAMNPFLAKVYYPGLQETPVLWSIPVAFGVKEKNTALRLAMNSALSRLQHNGQFDAFDRKYFRDESVKCIKS